MKSTSVLLPVMACYISYVGHQNWGNLSKGWVAFQQLQNMPQEHIDDFFAAYDHLEVSKQCGASTQFLFFVLCLLRLLPIGGTLYSSCRMIAMEHV